MSSANRENSLVWGICDTIEIDVGIHEITKL